MSSSSIHTSAHPHIAFAGSTLSVERYGPIARLQFNRPSSLNAINVEMAHELLAAARRLSVDNSVRCVILSGAGKGFMAGGDLATLSVDSVVTAKALLLPINEAVNILHEIDAPLIAQVHGMAAGAGMSLMLQADFVIAAEGTKFNLAYINVGTCCDAGASWALPRLVGLRSALEIAMLGETIGCDDALRLGLVNRVVQPNDIDEQVMIFSRRLAKGPTIAYGHMRRLLRSSFDRSLPAQLKAELAAFAHCAGTADFHSGVNGFITKHVPSFEGK